MRIPGSKIVDSVLKNTYNRTHIGKALHRLKNTDRCNAVFIWIPKNAGTSIYHALRNYGCLEAKNIDRIKYRFSQRGLVTFAHMDYFKLVTNGHIDPTFDESAVKFCFSRNPYDRAVSLYAYLTTCLKRQVSFLEFWQRIYESGVPPIAIRNETVLDTSICNAQIRWIEKLDIDFVGSFESLHDDFRYLAKRLGLPDMQLERRNVSERTSIADYYCRKSKYIIEDLYYEDFVNFDYDYLSNKALGINQHQI